MKRIYSKSAAGLLAKLLHETIEELDMVDRVNHRAINILETSKNVKLKNAIKHMTKGEISFTFIPLLINHVLQLKSVKFLISVEEEDRKYKSISKKHIGDIVDVSGFLYEMTSKIILDKTPDEKYIYNQSSKALSIGGVVRALKKAEFSNVTIGFIIERKNNEDLVVKVKAKI